MINEDERHHTAAESSSLALSLQHMSPLSIRMASTVLSPGSTGTLSTSCSLYANATGGARAVVDRRA